MKKIALIHSGLAYAPEIGVYKHFLEREGYFVQLFKEANESDLKLFDVEWHFMGMDMSQRSINRLKIHEYVSLSVPPFPKWKDCIKKIFNSNPDLRIFGSEFIEKELGFKDSVPVRFRDAGVSPVFFQKSKNIIPEFDFVYIGTTDKTRKIEKLLSFIVDNMTNNRLLIIGTPPIGLPTRIVRHPAISFTGRINYEEVPSWLHKSRFGINYIPDIYPYNQQRPLKLLEYCAAGLPIITTDYDWVNEFEKNRNGNFFKLQQNFNNFNIQSIESFQYHSPDVSDFTWGNILRESKILEWLSASI
ncbi:MAG: glycosyltransferase [Saprospiraceae bacterium]|nr:glycosyltransferase [Saprospiraceae bacterium]